LQFTKDRRCLEAIPIAAQERFKGAVWGVTVPLKGIDMCCFSKPVRSVSNTNIFARAGEGSEQFLAYSMSVSAREDLAMILPLPVKSGTGEEDVKFIDLKDYPSFFGDLSNGFPTNADAAEHTKGGLTAASAALPMPKLEVVSVGDFEASFVPTVKDFARLDERFRLPADTWEKIPGYESYGFAVFKLKLNAGVMGGHPMAFSFPRKDAGSLFFPTVHIHDGKVHSRANFDHVLYGQPHGDDHPAFGHKWVESHGHASQFVQVGKSKGLVEADQHCYKREMHGELPNQDTVVKLSA
jgi:hypothetical protein